MSVWGPLRLGGPRSGPRGAHWIRRPFRLAHIGLAAAAAKDVNESRKNSRAREFNFSTSEKFTWANCEIVSSKLTTTARDSAQWLQWGNATFRFYCACAKRQYIYLRSKIWRHRRIPRPRFPIRRQNFGDSRTVKADIILLKICIGFPDILA